MNIKPFLLPVIATLLILVISGLIAKNLFFKPANAGLKVETNLASIVYLDGKEIGRTPFESEKLTSGEKNLKIVPEQTFGNFNDWEIKVKLASGAMAVVKKEFADDDNYSSHSIVTMESITDKKSSSLLVVSIPDSVVVKIDSESKGFTPVSLDKLTEGDKTLVLSSPEFKEKVLNTKLFNGFKTIINVKLSRASEEELSTLTPTPSAGSSTTPSPSPSPKPSVKVTPTPTLKVTPTVPPKPYVEIKPTETGWLRVRAEASKASQEIGRVNPGEKYSLLDEVAGWYKITFGQDKEGWISSVYATKIE